MSDSDKLCLLYTTLPSGDVARSLAIELVASGLVACVNILPQIESVYKWNDKIETSHEATLLIKVLKINLPEAKSRLKKLHPYEVPCIWSTDLLDVDEGYLNWAKSLNQ